MSTAREFLNTLVTVTVDRPLGSTHPRHHDVVYEANYGFIPNTIAHDGEELDAYVLGVNEPLTTFNGRCVAYIHRTNDDDDKLIVVPDGVTITNEEIHAATHFQERYFMSEIIR